MFNSKTAKNVWIALSVICVAIIITGACAGALIIPRYSEGITPDATDLVNAVAYKRVLLIGVDGAGNYFADVDTPNYDRIFANGSVNYEALSQYPTISAQNWTSIFHGVRYQKHGVTNAVAKRSKYRKTQYPSVFEVCAKNYPDAQMISLTAWYPLNYGCIEDTINLRKYSGPTDFEKTDALLTESDAQLKDTFISEIEQGLDPIIAFMYFAQVDMYGHTYGRNDLFTQSMQRVDGYIGEIYDAYAARHMLDDTLFIFVTDHGHRAKGGHGFNSKDERLVTVAVAGAKGNIIAGTPGKTVTQDVASIILYGLGIRQPDSWESKVPYGIFNTLKNR